ELRLTVPGWATGCGFAGHSLPVPASHGRPDDYWHATAMNGHEILETAARRSLEAVGRRIRQACEEAGRAPGTVRLLAVGKTFPAERLLALAAAGQRD